MSVHLPFGNVTDSELLSFIYEHDIPPFSQYSHFVIQRLISSHGHDVIYNPDSQFDIYNDNFTCHLFDLDNEDLEKIITSTASNSCLTLACLNIKCVSKIFETFQKDIGKLKFVILGP